MCSKLLNQRVHFAHSLSVSCCSRTKDISSFNISTSLPRLPFIAATSAPSLPSSARSVLIRLPRGPPKPQAYSPGAHYDHFPRTSKLMHFTPSRFRVISRSSLHFVDACISCHLGSFSSSPVVRMLSVDLWTVSFCPPCDVQSFIKYNSYYTKSISYQLTPFFSQLIKLIKNI